MKNSTEIDDKIIKGTWRTIDIQVSIETLRGFSLLEIIWGTDIWINKVPILKSIVAANFIIWIILFLTR